MLDVFGDRRGPTPCDPIVCFSKEVCWRDTYWLEVFFIFWGNTVDFCFLTVVFASCILTAEMGVEKGTFAYFYPLLSATGTSRLFLDKDLFSNLLSIVCRESASMLLGFMMAGWDGRLSL